MNISPTHHCTMTQTEPTTQLATQPASKAPAKKTLAKKVPTKRPAVKKAVAKKAPAKPAPVLVPKPAPKVAAKKPVTKPVAKPAKPKKPAKVKVIRDSFTMPEADFAIIDRIKLRAIEWKQPVKKSEVLRAALYALGALPDAQVKKLLSGLSPVKKGRPNKVG
jgi:outer membrane biosynthesis protein TonB